jgi:hypothetical protein
MRKFNFTPTSATNPPVTSIAAHVILGLAMLGAVVIGANDFSVQSLANDLGQTVELQGDLSRQSTIAPTQR